MAEFFAMRGYAAYIWSAYGAAAVMIVGMVVATLSRWHKSRRTLAALERRRGRGRRV